MRFQAPEALGCGFDLCLYSDGGKRDVVAKDGRVGGDGKTVKEGKCGKVGKVGKGGQGDKDGQGGKGGDVYA